MSKTGTENKKNKTVLPSNSNLYKQITEARKKQESFRKSLKQKMATIYPNAGYLPGSISSKINLSNSINNSAYIATNATTSAITINGDPTNGSMRVDVPLIVNGRNVIQELDEMRDALLLLKRDVNMEAKYPRLKQLKDEYERELEKYKTFDILKESK